MQALVKTLRIKYMTLVQTLTRSTAQVGRRLLEKTGVRKPSGEHDVLVPICHLGPEHTPALLTHLLALSEHDRYLRFGFAANDDQIKHYIDGLNFQRDEIYGIFNLELEIVGMAHLALVMEPGRTAFGEFGVSVSAHARGRGYGARMFERAVIHARNAKVSLMYIHALSENAPMIRIARKAGATIERDGSETEAYLRLPKRDLDSRVTELVVDQFAKTNYSIKEDAKRFWDFLACVQEIRRDVRRGRHKSAQ
jgi:RimJ/RimL family protein N-acetyltransferase